MHLVCSSRKYWNLETYLFYINLTISNISITRVVRVYLPSQKNFHIPILSPFDIMMSLHSRTNQKHEQNIDRYDIFLLSLISLDKLYIIHKHNENSNHVEYENSLYHENRSFRYIHYTCAALKSCGYNMCTNYIRKIYICVYRYKWFF